MEQKKNIFKMTLFFALFFSINSAVVAQETCNKLISKGEELFKSNVKAAKVIFEIAKQQDCTNAQPWIDKCNAKLKSSGSNQPNLTCTELWKLGEDEYKKGDWSTAMIWFKEFENKKCKNAKLQAYLQICNEKIEAARLADIIANPTLDLSQTNLEFDGPGGKIEIIVTTNQPTWSSKYEVADWFSVKEGSILTVECKPNETTSVRNAKFTVIAGTKEVSVSIKQAAMIDWKEIEGLLKKNLESNPQTKSSYGLYKGELVKNKDGKKIKKGLGAYWSIEKCWYYFGSWDEGKDGKGIIIWELGNFERNCDNCAVYAGDWVDFHSEVIGGVIHGAEKHGFGRCYDRYGNLIHAGNFEHDKLDETYPNKPNENTFSFLEIKYPNGNRYVGEMQNGKKHGLGIYFYADGNMSYAMYENDQIKGEGVMVTLKGEVRLWDGIRFNAGKSKK